VIKLLGNWPELRWPWLLLAGSALGLELSALFFQYGLDLQPCIMCIYERVATLGLLLTGLIVAIAPAFLWLKLCGFAGWLISAIWGLKIAIEHVDLQLNPSPFTTCDFEPNFPDWLQLHQWFPMFFEATGDCGKISWSFLGWSMPQWLIVCFAIYVLLAIVVIAAWSWHRLTR
jgi:disulfide bond formation protein DsbB